MVGGGPAQAHVGGAAANFADVGRRVNDRLPVFVAAVLALSFVLLMLVFRSVFVPLKAVLLNLLSIGAAYGVMVMVFQWGWGGALIGLEATVPIVSFIPMFMFAILFGLSMDYEVFLLSRVREEYLRTGDNGAADRRGVSSTARVITSAALIMVAVFLAFVFGAGPATKMFGLGLATAIFVDATVVRMVLVPGDHDPARPGQLVAAGVARPPPPAGHRGRRPTPTPTTPTPTTPSADHAAAPTTPTTGARRPRPRRRPHPRRPRGNPCAKRSRLSMPDPRPITSPQAP